MKGTLVHFEIYEQGKLFIDSVVIDKKVGDCIYLKLKLSMYDMRKSTIFKSIGYFNFARMPGIILCDNSDIGKFTKVVFTEYKGYKAVLFKIIKNKVKVKMEPILKYKVEGDHPICKRLDYLLYSKEDADDIFNYIKNIGYETRMYKVYPDGKRLILTK